MDVVRNYLRERGYADFVIRDGLAGLVEKWDRVVASVAAGQEQFQDDYLNDMDGRRILDEALTIALPAEKELWSARLVTADQRIREHLVATMECIWGEENARKYGYTREHDWWYFHRPRVVEPGWTAF